MYGPTPRRFSQTPPPDSEQAIAQAEHLTTESYVLDSIFTHKSARYAVEGVLYGFATDAHVEYLRWSKARFDQFPDHVVRRPLANPPN